MYGIKPSVSDFVLTCYYITGVQLVISFLYVIFSQKHKVTFSIFLVYSLEIVV